jgi:O-antigen/teichoic acid export membrane protein
VGGLSLVALVSSLTLVKAFAVSCVGFFVQALSQTVVLAMLTRGGRRSRTSRAQRREMLAFGCWMQLNGISELLNNQTDRFVVGAIAGVPMVGTYEIGNTVGRSGRLIPGQYLAALGPRMTSLFTAGDRLALETQYLSSFKVLACVSLPLTGLLAAAGGPAVRTWLGTRPAHVVAVIVLLVLGYAINSLTGPASSWVRASGRPGLETSYGALQTVVNVALTIPGAWLFGLVGVVSATSVAAVVASTYFLVVFHRTQHVPFVAPLGPWLVKLVVVTATATALAHLVSLLVPDGADAGRLASSGRALVAVVVFGLVLGAGAMLLRVDPLSTALSARRRR